ncbi:hypothetical protein GCM10011391_22000 [Pullulanibacillus camelliae]|uniref:Bypass of forespore C C-terminal domain-containing protein n=1 Tax=Pullulanibacillus camelliae TaxID=1707096 RepID=A0A8J2YHE5_9BACL|nr:BofC C-terminal domain-containing protein [Pullulanibacillus camelliae]GGE42772.1 hypothetical protein GCM10011391_22000 [Pullulanibacillus camelliae]
MKKRLYILLVLACFSTGSFLSHTQARAEERKGIQVQAVSLSHIHMNTRYIDGISIQKTMDKHVLSLKDFLHQHPQWTLIKKTKTDVFLERKVDDLSPVSKAVGVLGLKNGNTLTLFNGSPEHNQIIQTFFQIDIHALQAKDFNRLKTGIPITNKEAYQNMLHLFAKYEVNVD